MTGSPWLEIGGAPAPELSGEIDERIRRRVERGVLTESEIDDVRGWALRELPRLQGVASDALRHCCVSWEIDRRRPIRSHRRGIGWMIVLAKKVVRRLVRQEIEEPLARQREFNRNLVLLLTEELSRRDRGER